MGDGGIPAHLLQAQERLEQSRGASTAPLDAAAGATSLLPIDSALHAALAGLAAEARLVFFAGLPGTGKSLLIHQLARLAHARGRRVHLLQWDVARPVFEASPPGRAYPQRDGVTHGVIRLAVGRWARDAIARWHLDHPGVAHLLVGEAPFIGHRLIELARPARDAAEPVLSSASARFVIPVPSPALRAHIEAERERRARQPLHPREREDAPPDVLRDLWRQVVAAARALGIADAPADAPYDPAIYRAVYEHLLAHRHAQALELARRLPTGGISAYEFGIAVTDLAPNEEEAAHAIREVARATTAEAVRRAIDRWYLGS